MTVFRDQPDYCEGIDRPDLALIARSAIARYLEGDAPATQRDQDHAKRDPEGWRRFTIHRTRWRLEREAEAMRAEMIADMHHEMMGGDGRRPLLPIIPSPKWLGEGDVPWNEDY